MCQRNRAARAPLGPSGLPADLEEAYRRAVYRVTAEAAVVELTVGEGSSSLVRLLDSLREPSGPRSWALISAANPGSVELTEEENRARHERLLGRLRAGGLPLFAAESSDPASGGWREVQLLVVGIGREKALHLAREFGQSAILFGEAGGVVELVATAKPPKVPG